MTKKLLRIYLCLLVFGLPFIFGSYAGGTENPTFPTDLFAWLISGLTPSWPAFLAAIFAGIALLWAVAVHRPPAQNKHLPLCLIWGLPIIAGLISLCVTTEYDYACNWLIHFTGAITLAIAIKWTADNDEKLLPQLSIAIVVAFLLVCLCGWYQHFIGLDSMLQMFRNNAIKTGVPLDSQIEQKLMQKRIYAFFIDPNLLAAHLILISPLAIVILTRWSKYFQPANASRIVFIVIGLVLYFTTLYWTGSRGGAIGACLGIAVFVWCQPFIQRLRWRWILPILAIVGVIAIVAIATRDTQREGAKSASARLQYYKVCLQMFKERPMTGHGLGEFFPNYMRLKSLEAEETRDPHNFLLGMMAQCGILGGIAAICALGLPFLIALKGKLTDSDSPLLPAVLSGLCAWSAHTLFEFNELIPGTFYIVVWFLCFILPQPSADSPRLPKWARIPAAILAIFALLPLLRIPAEYTFQQLENGNAEGSPFSILKELDERLPRSVGPADVRYRLSINALLPRPDSRKTTSMPENYAAENAWQSVNILVKRTPHRSSSWHKYALTAAAMGNWDETRKAVATTRQWYPTNGDYCLLDAIVQAKRQDWLNLSRMIDVKMHPQDDNSVLGLFVIPAAFVPQVTELKDFANNANITLADGRPVRFDFTIIQPPQPPAP